MDGEVQHAREMKILADILALALDEQPGVSVSALDAVKQRARLGGVTGGALKEAFLRSRSDSGGSALPLARARAQIEALRSQVLAAEQMRRQELRASGGALRRARLGGLLAGLLAGGGLVAVLARCLQ